jgi:hypothetical protein
LKLRFNLLECSPPAKLHAIFEAKLNFLEILPAAKLQIARNEQAPKIGACFLYVIPTKGRNPLAIKYCNQSNILHYLWVWLRSAQALCR